MIDLLKESLVQISEKYDSDIYLFSATVTDKTVDTFILILKNNSKKKKNCYLILTTNGGDPDAGYRLVRTVKRMYNEFIICVLGSCKSTGTLIALGADKIIMGDFGEFGPLDIQLTKDDELSNTSGLSYLQSLMSLNEQAFTSFEASFMNLKRKSGFTITTKTAAEIASKISIGIISPISAQIDPIKLGEVQRAISIAEAYGKRLCDKTELLVKLIAGFPSHSFVIDFEECEELFGKDMVSFASKEEFVIEHILFQIVRQEGSEDIVNNLINQFVDTEANEGESSENIAGKEVGEEVNEQQNLSSTPEIANSDNNLDGNNVINSLLSTKNKPKK